MTDNNQAGRVADDPTFEAPWQARAFAIAVSLTDRGGGDLPWEDFQARLIDEIETDTNTAPIDMVYYEQWLRALERLLIEEAIIEPGELVERASEFEAGDRDASEFVIGNHSHPHGHHHHD